MAGKPADEVKVWDAWDKEITGETEPWDEWEKVKAVKGFPGGLIAFLQTSVDSDGCGFTYPSSVQSYAWPILQSGKDLVGVAKTGSGKTLAFLLPGFIKIRKLKKAGEVDTAKGPALLCMTPTRELCFQIFSDAEKFGKPVQITAACAYGGAKKSEQEWKIKEGPDCLIATPGRLNDFCNNWVVDCSQVRYCVLDEADRMLDMGFEPQIKEILDRVPAERQMSMFTATWPKECRELARKYIKDPVQIQIGSANITANTNITQKIEVCNGDEEKRTVLKRILKGLADGGNCLVFSNTKKNCSALAWELNEDKALGLWTKEIHGDLDQSQRDASLNAFRSGEARVLCATDVAARGLDIRNITVVVNYDCPKNAEDYVHRIGRTGRASDRGEAYTLLGNWGVQKEASFIIEVMEQGSQEVPSVLRDLADGKSVGSTAGSDDSGGGNSGDKKDDAWGAKKDDDWGAKKDDSWGAKKDDSWGAKKDDEWKKDDEPKKDDDKWKKDDSWKKDDWKKDEPKKDEGSEWKKDEWKKDEWKKEGAADEKKEEEKKEEEPEVAPEQDMDDEEGGTKRKALWDLLGDGPADKKAKTDDDAEKAPDGAEAEEAAEAEFEAAFKDSRRVAAAEPWTGLAPAHDVWCGGSGIVAPEPSRGCPQQYVTHNGAPPLSTRLRAAACQTILRCVVSLAGCWCGRLCESVT
eukprot:CAMPEP_0183442212 /NCGR_PEP_ID=MMETSP0370-20130417/87457_1 /TAXON_ID=268820 /ORGANISM="Peridinium aciculiferum, Strain PAER-2" /LENGTH=691 /DNA_ID=CAMNT_0025631757 /DNA_START=80 /DNA_END=2159 /DNA_ORIENTATION=-